MAPVRALRIVVLLLYASYLTNVGMLLVVLPWSEAWARIVFLFPYRWALMIDTPAVRGALSAFGVLHLALLVTELVIPFRPRHGDD